MRRSQKTIDSRTVAHEIVNELTESESTRDSKQIQLFGLPLYNISYNYLPKKFPKFLFFELILLFL